MVSTDVGHTILPRYVGGLCVTYEGNNMSTQISEVSLLEAGMLPRLGRNAKSMIDGRIIKVGNKRIHPRPSLIFPFMSALVARASLISMPGEGTHKQSEAVLSGVAYLFAHGPEVAAGSVQKSQRGVVLRYPPRIQNQDPIVERHRVQPSNVSNTNVRSNGTRQINRTAHGTEHLRRRNTCKLT